MSNKITDYTLFICRRSPTTSQHVRLLDNHDSSPSLATDDERRKRAAISELEVLMQDSTNTQLNALWITGLN